VRALQQLLVNVANALVARELQRQGFTHYNPFTLPELKRPAEKWTWFHDDCGELRPLRVGDCKRVGRCQA
jgi:hypothetical protein